MHDNTPLIKTRIERLLRDRISPAKYRQRAPLTITRWEAPGEPVSFEEAKHQAFTPFDNGGSWGEPWGTTWFHLTGNIPNEWRGEEGTTPEIIADIGFNTTQTGFQCEGMAYRSDGSIIKAVEPHNRYISLPGAATHIDIFLEAASNPDVIDNWSFRPTYLGRKETSPARNSYRVKELALGLLDCEVWSLERDIQVLLDLALTLDETSSRRARIFAALSDCLRAVNPDDVAGSAKAGRQVLRDVLSSPATASAHTLYAVGHAHIDSAWLWPIRETARKVARTFSNALDLMDKDPDFIFAASSAQQYAWIKELYPELFARLKKRVTEGRFVPVGGMWVESDTNLPGGEALARQFVRGAGFFRREFGIEQPEVWLPDSFGYSASLPQIIRLAGASRFLTQKISWNQVNRMPHHTFWWEGIDGTRVFTHFPPVDSYACELTAKELKHAEDEYADKAVGTTSLVPFGYGDGGGGPTREMLGIAHRTRDLEGSPKVQLSSPSAFFEVAAAEYPNAPVWSGELYLEIHRGTYTSQARTKRGNRTTESLLRAAELWATTATVRGGYEYPYETLDRIWEKALLYQFHDILPGTSIGWVHDEVERTYAELAEQLKAIIEDADQHLSPRYGSDSKSSVLNYGPFPVQGIPALAAGTPAERNSIEQTPEIRDNNDGSHTVITQALEVTVAQDGTLPSIVDKSSGRQVVPPSTPLNQLQIFRDTPAQWDAWDIDIIDRETRIDLDDVTSMHIEEANSEVRIITSRQCGASTIIQEISIPADAPTITITTKVDWHEKEKMLKLAFPLDLRAEQATSEIQFGHIHRPLHTNTSWDIARFETPAHRWVHVGEPGFGVSLANDATYGHDFGRWTREDDGGTTTQIRQSLLRAPLYPDPQTDQGEHVFVTRLRIGATIPQAIADGYQLNLPLIPLQCGSAPTPLLQVDNPAVVIESVKLAEDRSGDVIVRAYEAHGTRAAATVMADFDFDSVAAVNLQEQPLDNPSITAEAKSVSFSLRPFQIVTLRFRRRGANCLVEKR